jgi:hypothetical protein
MPRTANTYTVPFDPIRNGSGEFATAREKFNLQRFVKKRGSRTTPYPSFVDVYQRSKRCVADADTFEDLQLADFVEADKRWTSRWISFWYYLTCSSRVSRYRLRDDQFVSRNLRVLLERGVQKSMDAEEPRGPVDPSAPPLAIETMLGYTGSVGTALWYEIGRDRGKVG